MTTGRSLLSRRRLLATTLGAAALLLNPAALVWTSELHAQAPARSAPVAKPAATEPAPTDPPVTEPPVETVPPVETDPPTTTSPVGPTTTTTSTSSLPSSTTSTSVASGTTTTSTTLPFDTTTTTTSSAATTTTTSTTSTTSTTTTTLLPVEPFGPLPEWNMRWRGGGSRSSGRAPGATWPVPGRAPGVVAVVVGAAGSGIGTGIGTGSEATAEPDNDPEGDGEVGTEGGVSRADLPVEIDAILSTLRAVESGGDYLFAAADGRTGAYRYGPERWGGYAGYEEARLAPAAVQDARARADVQRMLGEVDGSITALAGEWFLTSVTGAGWWDQYAADRSVSMGVFEELWLDAYAALVAPATLEPAPADDPDATGVQPGDGNGDVRTVVVDGPTLSTVDPAAVTREDPRAAPPDPPAHGSGAMRSIAFPVLGPVDYGPGWNDCRDDCTRRHEGVDIVGVRMQPLLAAVDGTVTAIGARSATAGIGVTITGDDGWRYGYYHVNNDNPGSDDGSGDIVWHTPPGLGIGDRVQAGEVIAYMGDSGNSEFSVPHLHFEIRDPSGTPHDPYWALQAAERRQACTIGIGPWSNPISIGEPPNGVAYTTVTPLYGDGQWHIDSQGRVTATGDAALIVPSRGLGCLPGPTVVHGTDAGGWKP